MSKDRPVRYCFHTPSNWCLSWNWTQPLWSQPKLTKLLNEIQLWDRGVGHTQWPTVGVSVTLQCWHGKSFVLTGIHDCTCKFIFWVSGEHGSCSRGHLRIQLGKFNCHELVFRNLKWLVFLFIFLYLRGLHPTIYLKQSGALNYNMAAFLLHFITKLAFKL